MQQEVISSQTGSAAPAQASQAWRKETRQRRTTCPGHQGLTQDSHTWEKKTRVNL